MIHKLNQIVILKDKTKVKVESQVNSFPCAYFCYFGKQDYHLGFNYACDKNLLFKQLGRCKVPNDCCYTILTEFRRGV